METRGVHRQSDNPSKSAKSLFFKINLILLTLITINIIILIFTKGYEISLGFIKISSHRAGRLFIIQVILALALRIFFSEKIKKSPLKDKHLKSDIFPNRNIIIIALIVIVITSFCAYYWTLTGYFLSDDFEFLNLFNKSNFFEFKIFFDYFKKFGFVRPLSLFSLYADYLIWNLNSVGPHLTSLFIHIFNSFLVFLIFYFLLKEQYLSMLIALLFSIYPLHLESVAWISGRFDILCTFFYLSSILFFLIAQKKASPLSSIYFLSLVAFIFALFSKEMAITLPIAILLFDLFFIPKSSGNKYKLKMHFPFWLILLFYFLLRIVLLGNIAGYSHPEGKFILLQGNIIYNLKHLLLRPFGPLFVPLNESLFTHYTIIKKGILLILTMLIFFCPFRRKLDFKPLIFGLLFIFIAVLPLFKILYISKTLEGSRFLYLSSIGACMIIASLIKVNPFGKEKVRRTINLIIPIFVLIFFLGVIIGNSNSWIKASEISKKISYQAMEKIQDIKSKKVIYAVNLPDNYNGAYIFRNGFSSSLDLLGKPDYLRIIDIKKINSNQFRKKSKYLILDWKKHKFQLYEVPYSSIMQYMTK